MELNSVKDRLKYFVGTLNNMSEGQVESLIGASKGWISKPGDSIRNDKLKSIRENFKDLNMVWLQTGHGEMLLKPEKEVHALKNEAEDLGDVVEEYQNHNNDFELLENGLIRMRTKLVTIKASAGYLTGWGDQEYINDLPSHEVYVREYHKGTYRSFEAVGDSMNDGTLRSIPQGSIATGRLISRHLWKSKLHLSDYQRFIIVTYDDGIIMKEIIAHDVENGIITCHSLNPNKDLYADFDLPLSKVMQIFNIVQVTLIDK